MSEQIDATEARLSTHEQVCAHRYEGIQKSFESGSKRMAKIEYLLYAVIAAVLLLVLGLFPSYLLRII